MNNNVIRFTIIFLLAAAVLPVEAVNYLRRRRSDGYTTTRYRYSRWDRDGRYVGKRRYYRRRYYNGRRVAGGIFGGAATGALIGGIAGGGRGAGIGAGVGAGLGLFGSAASSPDYVEEVYETPATEYYDNNNGVYFREVEE